MGEAEHHLCKKATEGLHHGQQGGQSKAQAGCGSQQCQVCKLQANYPENVQED